MPTRQELNDHLLQYKIPIPWCKRIDKFKPSKNLCVKHDWILWRRMEARRSQHAVYSSFLIMLDDDFSLAGMWSKLYH